MLPERTGGSDVSNDDDMMILAWMAGVFEGEGSIRINRPTRQNLGSLLVDLANTDRQMVDPFHAMWGGTVTAYVSAGRRRAYFRWRAAAREAESFLLAMWPMFGTEKYRARAVVGLDFQAQKHGHGGRVPDEYRTRQWDFYERMAVLNVRGVAL